MTETRSPIKLTMLVYRKKGMTEDDFHKYWTTKHVDVVSDWLQKYGITRYIQYHTPSSVRWKCSATFGSDPLVSSVSDHDGAVELLMPDIECFKRARADPYYESHVKPDEENFFDGSRTLVIFGYEEQKF